MFVFEEPFDSNDDWYLGDKNKYPEKIPKELLKNISNAHITGIQFLFDNFMKKRGGAILNEDEELNMPLQVCIFLSALKEKIHEKTPVLIVSSEYSLCRWHYHATEVGFQPEIITTESNDFIESAVYLLSSELLMLGKKFLDLDLFCVVIDDLDVIATKLLLKKLRGGFNIGLTKRNFYKYPDQKLKWSMLNWSNPGCVGKLNDYYRIDLQHSLAFADNYRFWWMRLTWNFCDSFEQPSEEELEEYQQKLQEWGNDHNIRTSCQAKRGVKRSNNRNQSTEKKKSKRLVSKSKEIQSSSLNETEVNSLNSFKMSETHSVSEVESEITREVFQTPIHNSVKNEPNEENEVDSFIPIPTKIVKTEVSEYLKTEEDEPILSIIYSQTPVKTKDSLFIDDTTTQTSKNEFIFPLVDDSQSNTESQSFRKLSNVLENLSDEEEVEKRNSDDDSFFTEFILGKK